MQAIILAAGMGKRLKKLTQHNTKCMVQVNGITLIERLLRQLDGRGLERIVVVIGYEGQKLKDFIGGLSIQTPVVFVTNAVYDRTNNIYSLALAKQYLCETDTLLFESDIIMEDAVIDALIQDERESLVLVDRYESWMDGTCVRLTAQDDIAELIPGKKLRYQETGSYYKTVNIYKFSRDFSGQIYVPFLEAYTSALGNNEYYEQVLRVITMLDDPQIKAKRLSGQIWYEIDDAADLDIAQSLFAKDAKEKKKLLHGRYGGYWRYPKLLDFCYLVNPFFPTEHMKEEMKASFDALLTQYPSGMGVNALLAGRNFNVPPEFIAVGNGAAELIKSLTEILQGKFGVIRPGFEEYPNRLQEKDTVVFESALNGFSYGASDLIAYYKEHPVDHLILVNPDNPSGNYIDREGLMQLLAFTAQRHISFLLDESFVDFAGPDQSLIEEELLLRYPNLYIVKSISKSYGVPGIRLGILVSSDTGLIERVKKDVSIWNLNSFAELFMQLFEKYRLDYLASLKRVKEARSRMIQELEQIGALEVFPSKANFVMCRIRGDMMSGELEDILLEEHQILIKDLSEKPGFASEDRSYIRLAVRTPEENEILINALKNIFREKSR